MKKIVSFKDLDAWKAGMSLVLSVYALVRRLFPPQELGDRVHEVRLLG